MIVVPSSNIPNNGARLTLNSDPLTKKTNWSFPFHPERFNNFAKWEKKYEYYVPESRKNSPNQNPPYRFYRDNLTVEEILAMSKEPFEEAKDDRLNFVEYKQTEMWGHPLDISFGCTESCEVF